MGEEDTQEDPKDYFYKNWEPISDFIYYDKNLSKINKDEVNALALLLFNSKKDKTVNFAVKNNKNIRTFVNRRTKWTTRLDKISSKNSDTRLAIRAIAKLLVEDPEQVNYDEQD